MVRDLTVGKPLRQIMLFALPLLIGNIFQQFYSMVDTVIVGQYLGVKALAAVGATGALSFFILGFVQGVTSGLTIVTAECFGAGDRAGVKCSIRCCAQVGLVLSLVMTALSVPLVKPLLRLMRTPEELMPGASIYMEIICAGMFATIFYNLISSILRALGDSRTPLIFLIFSSLLNVFLDIILIAAFKMGVEGAAYATVLSQLIAGCLCLVYGLHRCDYLHVGSLAQKPDFTLWLKHLRIALPMGLQFSVTAIGSMIMQRAFNLFDTAGVAAYTAAMKVEQVMVQPSAALGITMATYCSQNRGAGETKRILTGMRLAALAALASCLAAVLLNFLWGDAFMGIFMDEKTELIQEYSHTYLILTSLFYPALSLLFIYRNALQGLGESLVPMLGGAGELIARAVICLTLPAHIGYIGACLASPIAWVAAGLLTASRYAVLAARWRKDPSLLQAHQTYAES